jgi:hypothetical protein
MLLEELRRLETELHTIEARRNRQRMETLLHPDFLEFGRSGTRYTRADILNEFGPASVLPTVRPGNFDLAVLAEGIALLTYASAHEDADGKQSRHRLRSSVWVRTETGWQMRFHQGTATAARSVDDQQTSHCFRSSAIGNIWRRYRFSFADLSRALLISMSIQAHLYVVSGSHDPIA